MDITINIPNRNYDDILSFCKANGLDVEGYIRGIVLDKHSINKFGDINDKIVEKVEKSTVESKKRTTRKKKVKEEKEPVVILTPEPVVEMPEPIQNTVVRKRKLS